MATTNGYRIPGLIYALVSYYNSPVIALLGKVNLNKVVNNLSAEDFAILPAAQHSNQSTTLEPSIGYCKYRLSFASKAHTSRIPKQIAHLFVLS